MSGKTNLWRDSLDVGQSTIPFFMRCQSLGGLLKRRLLGLSEMDLS